MVRGIHLMPAWKGDLIDDYNNDSTATLTFKDGEFFEFELSNIWWDNFIGVPRLPGQGASATGYKVSDRPRHEVEEPDGDSGRDSYEKAQDHARYMIGQEVLGIDGLDHIRKRKRTAWGSLRDTESALSDKYPYYRRRVGWEREDGAPGSLGSLESFGLQYDQLF